MAAGPLIPEGGAGIGLAGALALGILAFLAWCVCAGALYGWKNTFGGLIDALTSLLSISAFGVRINFGWPLDKLNNAVQHSLSVGVKESEKGMGLFFHAAGVIFGWMVNFMYESIRVTEHVLSWLIHVYIPGRASWAASVLYPPALIAKIVRSIVAKELPQIGRQAKAVAHDATTVIYRPVKVFGRRLTKAEKRIAALAAAIAALGGVLHAPGHVISLPKTWRGLTKRLARLEHRMKRAEGWLAAGTLALAMANVLGVTARCLRSGNIGRAARFFCGMERWLVDLLLLGAIETFAVADLCDFSDQLIKQAQRLRPGLITLVDVENALVGCHDFDAPMRLSLPPVSLPPLVDSVSLAA